MLQRAFETSQGNIKRIRFTWYVKLQWEVLSNEQ